MITESGPQVGSKSTMIAIYPPVHFRRQLSRFADLDIGQDGLHQTLVYLGELDIVQFSKAQDLLSELVQDLSPVELSVNGAGVFFNKKNVIWLSLNGVGLDEMRVKLLHEFNVAELKGMCTHGGQPHMTLGYYDDDEVRDDWWRVLRDESETDFRFTCSKIHLVRGDRIKLPFLLQGHSGRLGNPDINM